MLEAPAYLRCLAVKDECGTKKRRKHTVFHHFVTLLRDMGFSSSLLRHALPSGALSCKAVGAAVLFLIQKSCNKKN